MLLVSFDHFSDDHFSADQTTSLPIFERHVPPRTSNTPWKKDGEVVIGEVVV